MKTEKRLNTEQLYTKKSFTRFYKKNKKHYVY